MNWGGLEFYDKDGIPISIEEYGNLSSDLSYKVIARTTVTSAVNLSKTYDVSTVWLGIDHSFALYDGPPVIFETMVFGDGSHDLDCVRYCTVKEAELGHIEMVTVVAATLTDAIVMDEKLS